MKLNKLILASALGAIAASTLPAAVSFTMSNGTAVLTNLTISGNNTQRLVWGILVDSDNNGFAGLTGNGSYIGNGTLTPLAIMTQTGSQRLSRTPDGTSSVLTDDYLYLSNNVMATAGTGDSSSGLSKTTAITNIVYTGNVTTGDPFAIVWFNLDNISLNATTLSGVPNSMVPLLNFGLQYGVLTGNFSSPALTMPTDDNTTYNYATNFLGADPLRTAAFTLKTVIPEPSSALLLIGAGSLLVARRRRES